MELKGKNILVIGMARSGISAAKLCMQLQANVTVYDGKDRSHFEEQIASFLEEPNFVFGAFDEGLLDKTELIVISPGVPLTLPFVEQAKTMGIPIWSEIELAYRMCKAPIIGITGTNGKTTTTTLVGEIMKAYNPKTYVVGNIGLPFSEVVDRISGESQVVAELSSFQLETILRFAPRISAILNITPDHLNRHKTMEAYADAKLRITENQTDADYCILNYDNELCRKLAKRVPSKVIFFSKQPLKEDGVYIKDDWICTNLYEQQETALIKLSELGEHVPDNIMAGIAIAICADIPLETTLTVIKRFRGVAHRLEYVDTIREVRYINDSKATNEDAAINGVLSMKSQTVLIGGGMDKGGTFDEWVKSFGNRVRALVLFGETATLIEETARKYDFHQIHQVKDLQEAVVKASQLAHGGDSVLLSPACASWDMFRDYEQRGDLFKGYVRDLAE